MRLAAFRFDDRAVAYDQMKIAGQGVGNAAREVEPPPGDEQNFNSALGRLGDRAHIFRGKLRVAVEQRPVDIHGNQLDGHLDIVTGSRGLGPGSSRS